jgi:hypothetical protein
MRQIYSNLAMQCFKLTQGCLGLSLPNRHLIRIYINSQRLIIQDATLEYSHLTLKNYNLNNCFSVYDIRNLQLDTGLFL